MGDNNLDDLILTEPESEGGSNRGLLVILGLVVLLLILGVVLANIIFGDDSDANATTENVKMDAAQILDTNSNKENPALALNDTKTGLEEKAQQDSNLDSDLAPLDAKDILAKEDTVGEDNINVKEEEPKEDINDHAAAAATAATAAASAKAATKRKETPKVKHVTKPKKVQHKIKHITTNKPKPKKRSNAINYGGNTYIQVGSFSKGPSADFINKIRSTGLKYRIKEVNGFRRVLIGPFRSSADAQRVLGVVKAKVSSSAFIKR